MAATAKIEEGKVVNLSYSLHDAEGQLLDRADSNDPFTYLHGAQQIVPGLENALDGLNVGDKKKVTVAPAEAYGEMNPELKLTVNRTQFPAGAKIEAGMQFQTQTPDGHEVIFTVDGIEGDKIHLDGNHPLAGKTLTFDVEVLAVRDATEEEKEHGHAHGGDGHHHD